MTRNCPAHKFMLPMHWPWFAKPFARPTVNLSGIDSAAAYLADELFKTQHAIDVLVSSAEWQAVERLPYRGFWDWIQRVAKHIRTRGFYNHPCGPKRPEPKRASGKCRHDYSTYYLQLEAKKP